MQRQAKPLVLAVIFALGTASAMCQPASWPAVPEGWDPSVGMSGVWVSHTLIDGIEYSRSWHLSHDVGRNAVFVGGCDHDKPADYEPIDSFAHWVGAYEPTGGNPLKGRTFTMEVRGGYFGYPARWRLTWTSWFELRGEYIILDWLPDAEGNYEWREVRSHPTVWRRMVPVVESVSGKVLSLGAEADLPYDEIEITISGQFLPVRDEPVYLVRFTDRLIQVEGLMEVSTRTQMRFRILADRKTPYGPKDVYIAGKFVPGILTRYPQPGASHLELLDSLTRPVAKAPLREGLRLRITLNRQDAEGIESVDVGAEVKNLRTGRVLPMVLKKSGNVLLLSPEFLLVPTDSEAPAGVPSLGAKVGDKLAILVDTPGKPRIEVEVVPGKPKSEEEIAAAERSLVALAERAWAKLSDEQRAAFYRAIERGYVAAQRVEDASRLLAQGTPISIQEATMRYRDFEEEMLHVLQEINRVAENDPALAEEISKGFGLLPRAGSMTLDRAAQNINGLGKDWLPRVRTLTKVLNHARPILEAAGKMARDELQPEDVRQAVFGLVGLTRDVTRTPVLPVSATLAPQIFENNLRANEKGFALAERGLKTLENVLENGLDDKNLEEMRAISNDADGYVRTYLETLVGERTLTVIRTVKRTAEGVKEFLTERAPNYFRSLWNRVAAALGRKEEELPDGRTEAHEASVTLDRRG